MKKETQQVPDRTTSVQAAGPSPMGTCAELADLSAPKQPVCNQVAQVRLWISDKLSQSLQLRIANLASSLDVVHVAIMPDVHEGAVVPNGAVVATRRLVYPEMVGSDIGCGVSALRFRSSADDLTPQQLKWILSRLQKVVPTLKVPSALAGGAEEQLIKLGELSAQRLTQEVFREGRLQLGTLGRGNHFVELERAQDGELWAVVHSGSRAMGQAISAHHLSKAHRDSSSGLRFLNTQEPAGNDYLQDMRWATRYASQNRIVILNRLADLLEQVAGVEPDASSFVDSPHNFAREETHFGEQLIVHRKSANSARVGEYGVIPGSMSVGTRITVGLGNGDSLNSSSHGAGRVMSRSQAFDSIKSRDFGRSMQGVVFNEHLSDRLRDEAPRVYKDLNEVMRAQRDLVRTELTLQPILNDKRV